jgi:hypothetical protein
MLSSRLIAVIFLAGTLGLFFVPASVLAQEGSWPGPLVPCGRSDQNEPCTVCHAGELAKNLFDLIIKYLMPVAAVIALMVGGFFFFFGGANESALKTGKTIIRNTLIGVLIVLAAWLVVNTLVHALFPQNVANSWYKFQCAGGGITAPPPPSEGGGAGIGGGGGEGTGVDAGELTEAAAESQLAAAGVSINGGVELNGIRQSTINEVIRVKQSCGCAVTVTGGTGSNHAGGTYSHANGYKVDLRSQSSTGGGPLTNFITQNYSYIGRRSGDNARQFQAPNGVIYALEDEGQSDEHWDVLVR